VEDEGPAPGLSSFGMLLREYRLAAGLSQESLAERARMSSDGISALERGYRRTPQRETLALLAAALALSDEQCRALEAAAGRSGLARRGASVTAGSWPHARTSNLPLALTSFVGRERELDEIAILAREHRIVTLTGAGGIGKTRMALKVARLLGDDATGAVCFVGLAPVGGSSLVATTIASTFGLQELPNRPLFETLLAYLKNKSLLLILDNCEHVIAETAILADTLLAACPSVRILATSREPLRSAGEQAYRLPSLSVPSSESARGLGPADATAYGAIALFTDRARAVDHRFVLTDENLPLVAELCRRLDGIPLAIELAAARLNVLSVKALVEKLDDRFWLLTGGERTALPRQQTMRATIDWSYNLLSLQEQRMFDRLSVFAAGCTLATATTVCAGDGVAEVDTLELLSSLVDKSLVSADLEGSEPRYRLSESFRQYAHYKLSTRGEAKAMAQRHAIACLELAEWLDRAYYSEPDEVWRALAYEEMDNWRAALKWALTDHGDIVLGQRLVGKLSVVWHDFAPVEGRRWLVAAFEQVDGQTPSSVLAGLSYTEATIAWRLGEHKVQLASSESAIAHYRVDGDALGIARAQSRASPALMLLGRFGEAKALLQEVLAAARGLGNLVLAAYALRGLGHLSALEGDVVAARAFMAEALQTYNGVGNRFGAAITMADLGEFEFCAGNTELALRHATEAVARLRTLHDMRLVVNSLDSIAAFLIALARYDEAKECAREMLEAAREHHLDIYAVLSLQHLGVILALRPQAVAERKRARYAQAARILGFVDARLAGIGSIRSPIIQPEYDRVLSMLSDAFGADAVASLMEEGAGMTEVQAVKETLAI
jgi:predicted ATPase/DNA-binding XRE family transcriptional regulator